YFLNLYGYLKIDNLDNPNFPMNGLKFNGLFKYLFQSNSADFEEIPMISGWVDANKSLNSWLSIKLFGKFGTYFGKSAPLSQKFALGGYVDQVFMNYSRFFGLPYFTDDGENLLILGSQIQAKILKNHYL